MLRCLGFAFGRCNSQLPLSYTNQIGYQPSPDGNHAEGLRGPICRRQTKGRRMRAVERDQAVATQAAPPPGGNMDMAALCEPGPPVQPTTTATGPSCREQTAHAADRKRKDVPPPHARPRQGGQLGRPQRRPIVAPPAPIAHTAAPKLQIQQKHQQM